MVLPDPPARSEAGRTGGWKWQGLPRDASRREGPPSRKDESDRSPTGCGQIRGTTLLRMPPGGIRTLGPLTGASRTLLLAPALGGEPVPRYGDRSRILTLKGRAQAASGVFHRDGSGVVFARDSAGTISAFLPGSWFRRSAGRRGSSLSTFLRGTRLLHSRYGIIRRPAEAVKETVTATGRDGARHGRNEAA